MAGELAAAEAPGAAAPKQSVWRYLRENPYILGLSAVSTTGRGRGEREKKEKISTQNIPKEEIVLITMPRTAVC